MASSYPGSLDAFDTIAADKKTSDAVGGRTHRQMHNDLGDSIEAVQAELGTDPAGGYSTVKARLDALVAYAAKTSAYTATVADHTLNVTSGTFTLDLPAASTCTGQSLRVKNSGTGVVTLDGNSSETVEGIATFPLGPGSYVEITSTGSVWILTGGTPDSGWRALTLLNSWSGTCRIRRVGAVVSLIGQLDGTSASAATFVDLASGFGPVLTFQVPVPRSGTPTDNIVMEVNDGGVAVAWSGNGEGATQYPSATYFAGAAWPTSFPGTAA